MQKFLIFFLLLGSVVTHAEDNVRPSRLLLSAFANQCPQVVTRNVTATLINLQSLYSTIEELKNDTNCAGATAFAATVSRYKSLYENFETDSNSNQDKVILDKKIALYTSLLSDPAIDQEQANFLRTEIVTAQASLVSVDSNLARFKNFSGKEARIADQLVRSADDFLTNLQTQQGNACYQKNSAKVTSILSNALLVTAAFASGGTSLALAGGAVIVNSVGKYVGDLKYNESLMSIQDIEMPTALRCVSQALTDQFCSINETAELISERLDANDSNGEGYEGINLLSYQLSSLSQWLNEVYSGSSINSEGDLTNREKPEMQSEFLRKAATYLDTYGTIKKNFFIGLENKDQVKTAVSQNIDCLVVLLVYPNLSPCSMSLSQISSSVENPIFTIYSTKLLPYQLFDPEIRTVPNCGNDLCESFAQYMTTQSSTPVTVEDWERVIMNAKKIVSDAQNLVNLERSKMISVDAYSIVVNAKRELKGQISPLAGLKKIVSNADRIIVYLNKLDEEKFAPEVANIQKTKDLTNSIIALVNEGMIPRTLPNENLPLECRTSIPDRMLESLDVLEKKSLQITSCISKILKLQERGTAVYFNKIRSMVSYEMEARLLNNDLGRGVVDVVNSTRLDLIQSILNSYSSKDSSISLGELNISFEAAQNNSKETLNTFFDFFKKNVIESLKSDKISQGEKSDLCFRILPYIYSAKESFIKDVYPMCEKAQLSTYKNGPVMRFSDYVRKTPRKNDLRGAKYSLGSSNDVTKYFCGYRKYNRANLLIDEQNKQRMRLQRAR